MNEEEEHLLGNEAEAEVDQMTMKCNRCKLVIGEDEWHYKCTKHDKLSHIECASKSATEYFEEKNNANYSNCKHVEVNKPGWLK